MKVKHVFLILSALITPYLAAQEPNFIRPSETSKYKKFVDSVSYQVNRSKTHALIRLKDNSTWDFTVDQRTEHLLEDIAKDFSPGKEVDVKIEENLASYRLVVRTSNYKDGRISYQVNKTNETRQVVPKILDMRKIQTSKGGWFSSPEYLYVIYLSDGSQWQIDHIQNYETLGGWKIGDSILVTRDEKNRWNFININAQHAAHQGDGTVRDQRKFGAYWYDGNVNLLTFD